MTSNVATYTDASYIKIHIITVFESLIYTIDSLKVQYVDHIFLSKIDTFPNSNPDELYNNYTSVVIC